MVPSIVLQVAYDETQQPLHLFAQDILNPQQYPRDVRWNDKPPYAVVNIVDEPRRAFPTFVSFSKSYAFCGNGPGTILDIGGIKYVTEERNANEWKWAIGFLTSTTQLSDHSMSEY